MGSIYNLASQQLLNNSANLSYLARAGARNGTTPEDRRLDYFWRDAFMTVVTAYFFELCQRGVDANYGSPKLTQALELNQLAGLYEKEIKQKFGQQFGKTDLGVDALKKINFDGLDKVLHKRFLTQQLKPDNFGLVPELVKHDLHKVLNPASPGKLSEEEQLKFVQANMLVSHLQRRLNYQQLLECSGLPTPVAEKIMVEVQKCFDDVEVKLREKADFKDESVSFVPRGIRRFFQKAGNEKKYMDLLKDKPEFKQQAIKEVLDDYISGSSGGSKKPENVKAFFEQKLADLRKNDTDKALFQKLNIPNQLNHLGDTLHGIPQDTKKFLEDALESKFTQASIQKIKSSAQWPKLLIMLATNIVYFGVVGNWLDFNVVQPWQKKISQERGGVKELIGPAYAAMIPGALTVAGMFKYVMPKVSMLSKMGPAMQFMVAGTTGMGVYLASSYALVMARLNSLRAKDKLNKPAAQAPQQQAGSPFAAASAPAVRSNGFAPLPSLPLVPPLANNAFAPMGNLPPRLGMPSFGAKKDLPEQQSLLLRQG